VMAWIKPSLRVLSRRTLHTIYKLHVELSFSRLPPDRFESIYYAFFAEKHFPTVRPS
jgi:hypothetical protein